MLSHFLSLQIKLKGFHGYLVVLHGRMFSFMSNNSKGITKSMEPDA